MSIIEKLFSFNGRLRRRDFWLIVLGLCVISWVLNSIIGAMFTPAVIAAGDNRAMQWAAIGSMSTGMWIVALIMLWPSLAVGVKRCHDRNKSGWWMLLALIPVIGFLWWLIDLGILDGTLGPNRYGPSPKGLEGAPAAQT
jgi:uncharacterized membrane protein YhaH (DUF805 family)